MNKQEFETWLNAAYKNGNSWIEDIIYKVSGRGVLYFCGDENGKYISINKKGLLSVGSYEDAILHIDDAYFTPELSEQFSNFDEAIDKLDEYGGDYFWDDVIKQDIGRYDGLDDDGFEQNHNEGQQMGGVQ